MAKLEGQKIADSYEQLLHTDRDGGGNGTTLVDIKDGKNDNTFALQLATDKIQVNGNATITTADNTDTLSLISTDEDANVAPNLSMYRNSASPAVSDQLGQIQFTGRNNNSQDVDYAVIGSQIIDLTDGTEDGRVFINSMVNGTLQSRLDIRPTETIINNESIDLDFRIESDANTHAFFLEGSTGNIGIGTSTPSVPMHIYANDTTKWQSTIEQDGTGDAALKFSLTGARDWLMGLDNSDSDKFKIGYDANDLNDLNVLTLDTSGNVGIGTQSPSAKIHSTGTILIDQSSGTSNSAVLRLEADRGSADQDSGEIRFYNQGGSDHDYARIIGTRGGADNSGYLSFKTSEAGTEGTALKITSTQDSDFQSNYIVNEQGRQNHVANTMSSPYYRFDGVDDYIQIEDSPHLDGFTAFSITAKVYLQSISLMGIASKYATAGQRAYSFYISGSGGLLLAVSTDGSNLDEESTTSTPLTTVGVWYDVAVTFNAGTVLFYVNGVVQPSDGGNALTSIKAGSDPLLIGTRITNSTDNFDGEIQNLKVWNKALTATEIKDDYSGASVPFKYKGANQTDLVTNGTFTTNTNDWVASNATLSIDSNSLKVQQTSGSVGMASQGITTVIGKQYRLAWSIKQGSTTVSVVKVGTSQHGNEISGDIVDTAGGSFVQHTYEFTATATTTYIALGSGGSSANIFFDNASLVPIGAVAEYDGSGAGSKVWGDKSGNDLHGTVSGATLENTPYDSGTEYEEGTWTPVLAGASSAGTYTYHTQVGRYTKIGNIVHVVGSLWDIATSSAGSGNMRITGLPYTSENVALLYSVGTIGMDTVDLTGVSPFVSIYNDVSFLEVKETVDNGADVHTQMNDITSGTSDMYFQISYRCA